MKYLFNRWPGEQAAVRSRIKRANRVVIGVEQKPVLRVGRMVVWQEFLQHECFKKPAGVSQVPFRRAGLRHSLDNVIFGFQRFAQFLGETSNSAIPTSQLSL